MGHTIPVGALSTGTIIYLLDNRVRGRRGFLYSSSPRTPAFIGLSDYRILGKTWICREIKVGLHSKTREDANR